ncbi:MAG: phosphoglycerate dehydrogenase [Candidatus Bipolaricaulia bacterium]
MLVSSRSFGQVARIGNELLEEAGFVPQRIGPEERPLDAAKLARILAAAEPDVLIAGAEPIPRGVLSASPNLQMVQKHGVGVDNIDLDAATELGIAVANAPATNTGAVADLVLGFMLSLLRSIVPAVMSTRAGSWDRFVGHELGRLTVGVVGTGQIGRAVIRRLAGFGSHILAYDVYEDATLAANTGIEYATLERLLRESDVVTLHVPLLDSTRNLISAESLRWMKKSAFLINIARGELVDEAALAEHLAAGSLAGAGVDVFTTEPPQESPLLGLSSVIATPHIGAYTSEAMECMARRCAETVIAVLAGEYPDNVLNREALRERP